MRDQFDGVEAKRRRDAGIARVIENNALWAADVRAFIEELPMDWTGMAEDIRRLWFDTGGSRPRHHNAWGGVIQGAVKRGVLAKTGRRKSMNASSSHGRVTDVYIRTPI
jgi:hypothetical protein